MWFNQSPDYRILSWRSWRDDLEKLPLDEAIEKVAQDWARVPTVMHYLAPDNPGEWPNPWQLITDNLYCDLGIVLGMHYSLALLENLEITDLRLQVYQTTEGWLNLSSINQGKYVLNYHHGKVVNSLQVDTDRCNLMFDYSDTDLRNKFN